MLSAEIIAIGSELLTPERTDTNSLWLTEQLNAIGVEVMLKTIVGDDELRLEEVIRDAMKRSHIVITTGGLGPTEDDITRQIAAKAVDRELVYHDELEAELRDRFKRWGREMPEINKRQAYVIDGAKVLPNPNGSAVGMMLESDDRLLAVFPGPPREMRPMFESFVRPTIAAKAGGVIVCRRVMRVSGMGESAVDELISPIYKSYPEVQTSILFSRVEIEVHISTKTTDVLEGDRILDEVVAGMQSVLGNAMFATNGETMEEVVGKILREKKETLSVAESCTGGLVGMRLTEVSGSSAYFLDGAVTYSNDSKRRDLGVSEALILDHGAVSAEVAEAMAEGIRRRSSADHSISVTGIAGPDGGTEEKPVGTVFIGYSSVHGTRSMKFTFPGDRELIRWRSSQAALDYLRRQILKGRKLMKRISTHIANTLAKIKQLGRLTPMAIISMVLPMLGSYLIVFLGYPLGNWLKQDQVTGSVVFFLGVLILCGLAVLATNVIGVIGGWAFGFWLGLGLLISAIVGAAVIAFLINRRITGRKLTDLTSANPSAKAIYNALLDEGFGRTLLIVTLVRLSILMPFAFTNFFLAAAKVPIGAYVIGTAAGMLPRAAATTFIGAGLSELVLEGVTDHKMLVVGVAATVVMLIVISIISKRALMRLTGEELSAS